MSAPILLTPHQCDAVSYVVEHLMDGDPVVAIKGYAGTGKSSLLPALIDLLESHGIPCTVGAPTHRAAMVLRRKGLAGADTVHSHALVTYFDGDYTRALRWLGEDCPCKVEALAHAHPHVDGVAWLIAERLRLIAMPPEALKSRARQHGARRALESIGISGRNHMVGYGPKAGEGCLIIDEASMVGTDMMALCTQAYPMICLVGDPGQLPPVNDAAQLEGVPGYQLTELHRQAADSAIIQLAYAARAGEQSWEQVPFVAGEVEEYMGVEASAFLHSPLIVWRNKTRLTCTAAIRAALGYPKGQVQRGEPLVCRSTDPRDRAMGFFNNSLWRVVSSCPDNPRLVTLQPDGNPDAETHEVLLHMEETDGAHVDPHAVLCRWAYCLTGHTAQGGEWPTVYVSKPDLLAHSKRSPREGEEDDFKRWAYTAITRAKVTIGFLRSHNFTTQEDVTMPRMQRTDTDMTPPSAPLMGMPARPGEPDDIPDPVVPPEALAAAAMVQGVPGVPDTAPDMTPSQEDTIAAAASRANPAPPISSAITAAHEPLLYGFTQYMQQKLHAMLLEESLRMSKAAEVTIAAMADYCKGVLQTAAYAQNDLPDALRQLFTDGLKLVPMPYQVRISATAPGGFPVEFTLQKATAEEMIAAVTGLEQWLCERGYRAITVGLAA